ncbi:MAG: trypsin-like serine protease [Planctomycetota bacterium]
MRVLPRAGALSIALLVAQTASAQVEAPPLTSVPYAHDTGWVAAPTAPSRGGLQMVASFTVEQRGAEWLRLYFGDVVLGGDPLAGTGAELRLLGLEDGGFQRMDAIEVERWRRSTAYFNGDTVVVEVWAQPGTGTSRVQLDTVDMGLPSPVDTRSICGPVDDRLPSSDPRAGRLLPVGCTAWLIDDCGGCFLTAGHCTGNIAVVEFNVPPSSSNGSINHPGPEDQYPVDGSSLQSNGGQGVGNDWAYFGTFANGTTGLSAAAAQGATYSLSLPPAPGSATIRITGYGTDNSPPSRNQVQQTHTGPLVTNSGTTVQYRTDTTGGNSGSPVIWEENGAAVGIHTHGGCSSGGGQNSGTSYVHPALQSALASPRGVCAGGIRVDDPPVLVDRGVPTPVMAVSLGDVVTGTVTLHARASASGMFQSIPMTDSGSGFFAADLPGFACGDTPQFYVSAQAPACGQVFAPTAGPAAPFEAEVGTAVAAFADDFEANLGWQAENLGASSGAWQRGVPVNDPGWEYDPASDGDGSGRCFLTQNTFGNTDVDGGSVRLTSPVAQYPDASMSARYVYYLALTRENAEDALVVEVSANGGSSWTQVRRHDDDTAGAWVAERITAAELANAGVAVGSQLRLRFTANDDDAQSIVEAGVDGVFVGLIACDPTAIGVPECGPAVAHSGGAPATLRARGSETAADNDVLLIAESLPTNTTGYFLTSTDSAFVPGAGGSSGNLCLGGSVGRYVGNVMNSGPGGAIQLQLDLTNTPQPMGSVSVMAGETWRYQAWFRDFTLFPTSNFTDALAITFD